MFINSVTLFVQINKTYVHQTKLRLKTVDVDLLPTEQFIWLWINIGKSETHVAPVLLLYQCRNVVTNALNMQTKIISLHSL